MDTCVSVDGNWIQWMAFCINSLSRFGVAVGKIVTHTNNNFVNETVIVFGVCGDNTVSDGWQGVKYMQFIMIIYMY